MGGKNGMELDPTEPLYIIELGTGSGKFSFFMLKALLEMKVRCRIHAKEIHKKEMETSQLYGCIESGKMSKPITKTGMFGDFSGVKVEGTHVCPPLPARN